MVVYWDFMGSKANIYSTYLFIQDGTPFDSVKRCLKKVAEFYGLWMFMVDITILIYSSWGL